MQVEVFLTIVLSDKAKHIHCVPKRNFFQKFVVKAKESCFQTPVESNTKDNAKNMLF